MFVDFLTEYIGPPDYPHCFKKFEVTHVIFSVKNECGFFCLYIWMKIQGKASTIKKTNFN